MGTQSMNMPMATAYDAMIHNIFRSSLISKASWVRMSWTMLLSRYWEK